MSPSAGASKRPPGHAGVHVTEAEARAADAHSQAESKAPFVIICDDCKGEMRNVRGSWVCRCSERR